MNPKRPPRHGGRECPVESDHPDGGLPAESSPDTHFQRVREGVERVSGVNERSNAPSIEESVVQLDAADEQAPAADHIAIRIDRPKRLILEAANTPVSTREVAEGTRQRGELLGEERRDLCPTQRPKSRNEAPDQTCLAAQLEQGVVAQYSVMTPLSPEA